MVVHDAQRHVEVGSSMSLGLDICDKQLFLVGFALAHAYGSALTKQVLASLSAKPSTGNRIAHVLYVNTRLHHYHHRLHHYSHPAEWVVGDVVYDSNTSSVFVGCYIVTFFYD